MRFRFAGGGRRSALGLTLLAFLAAGAAAARPFPASAGAPAVGTKAPDFTLPDADGSPVTLSRLFAPEPPAKRKSWVLLVFYRGYWWPYCNSELRSLQEQLPEFTARGLRVIAVSVDLPEDSTRLASKRGYTFPLLSDSEAKVIRRYDVLHAGGAQGGADIARPAEFLIDDTGTVRWRNLAEDNRVRMRGEQVLEQLDRLGRRAY